MKYSSIFLILAVVDFVATATPGSNFMVVARSAIISRTHAVLTIGGVLASNFTWCVAVFLSLPWIFQAAPLLYSTLQIAGAVYLIYLAIGLWKAPQAHTSVPSGACRTHEKSRRSIFVRGWLVGMSNPKSLIYFSSVFTILLPEDSSVSLKLFAMTIIALNVVVWYGTVALIFSHPGLQQGFRRKQQVINRVASTLLGAFGIGILLLLAKTSP
jgi:threonine efflux protein